MLYVTKVPISIIMFINVLRFFVFVYNIFFYNVFSVEARVFCQDSNAKPWVALGYTCPIICDSVRNAIEKLIILDYKKSMQEQLGDRNKLNNAFVGHEYDDNDEIHRNYFPDLRRKVSLSDQNDKHKADFNNNLEDSNNDIDIVDENPKNSEYKADKNIDGHNKEELYNNIINVNPKKSNKNDNDNNKESKSVKVKKDYEAKKNDDSVVNAKKSIENQDEKVKFQADRKLFNIKILENIKNFKGVLRTSDINAVNNETKYDFNKNNNVRKLFNVNDVNIRENIQNVKGISRRNDLNFTSNVDVESGRCWFLEKFKPGMLVGKVVRRKCGRRSNFDAKFVVVMTNVLNKYVDTEFRFTDEMTEILLENIFGKNTDLRYNIFDVSKLLKYLRKSVDRHKIHSQKQVITLKSRHCLTVSMPGCFCRSGFVENFGQCVKPEDCITQDNHLQYLSRIVVV